jgi:hypothetical protein
MKVTTSGSASKPAPELDIPNGQRVSLSLVGLLHGLTLGSLLPVLPLFARRTLGYSWQDTSVVLSGLAVGILGAPAVLKVARKLRLDARLTLAFSHLVAGGLIMAMAWWRQGGGVESETGVAIARVPSPIVAAICAAVYSLALAPALRSLPDMARGLFPHPGIRGAQTWRLWAAVGFVLPAWVTEAAFVRVPAMQSGVASLDVLLMFCGWGGLLTAVVAMLGRSGSPGARPTLLEDESTEPASLGLGLVIALVFLVMVQKCHHLWTAPYFDEVARRNAIPAPMVHRLVVVSQVFEVLGLYLMTGLVRLGGARLLMLLGALSWIARSFLLGWMESSWATASWLGSKQQLGVLFLSQVLYGLALVAFLGALGSVLSRPDKNGGGMGVALLIGVATGFGLLCGGLLAGTLTVQNASTAIVPLIQKLPETINTGISLSLRGWSGVWLLSAGPAAIAALMLLVCRLPHRVEELAPADKEAAA